MIAKTVEIKILAYMEKIKIGISSCLLGEKVRYDGRHKRDHYITDTLGKYFNWVPICPEVEYGLPVPRESMRLVGEPDSPRTVDGMLATYYNSKEKYKCLAAHNGLF